MVVDGVILPFRRFSIDLIELESLGTFKVHERAVFTFIVIAHNNLESTPILLLGGVYPSITLFSLERRQLLCIVFSQGRFEFMV